MQRILHVQRPRVEVRGQVAEDGEAHLGLRVGLGLGVGLGLSFGFGSGFGWVRVRGWS